MKKISVIILLLTACLFSQAQILHPVKWAYGAKKLNSKEAVIFIKATIDDGWHIYSAYQKEGGPVPTSFAFAPGSFHLTGNIIEPTPKTRFEDAFNMNVSYFENSVIFQQQIKLYEKKTVVNGSLKFMCCNDHQCLAPETVSFSVPIN